MIKSVGVVGYGYWGKKLARVFKELGVLGAIVDIDAERRGEARGEHAVQILEHMDLTSSLDAMAIATPPETHFDLAKAALEHGFHTFVEKPLAMTATQARTLEVLALESKLKLQVGHIYLYNAGLMRIPKPEPPFEIRIRFLNDKGAPSSSTSDILYAAGPHAASIVCYFCKRPFAFSIDVSRFVNEIWISLKYDDGSTVFIDMGDYTGVRARTVQIFKGDEMWTFDASSPNECVRIRQKNRTSIATAVCKLPAEEPLRSECLEFLACELKYDHMGSDVAMLLDRVKEKCTESI